MGRDAKRPNKKGQWKCALCCAWKAPDEYTRATNTSNGLHSRCKDCTRVGQWANHMFRDPDVIRLKIDKAFPQATDEQIEELLVLYDRFARLGKSAGGFGHLQMLLSYERDLREQERTRNVQLTEQALKSSSPVTLASAGGYEFQPIGPPPSPTLEIPEEDTPEYVASLSEAAYLEWRQRKGFA